MPEAKRHQQISQETTCQRSKIICWRLKQMAGKQHDMQTAEQWHSQAGVAKDVVGMLSSMGLGL
jgi:hypothetical protein